MDFQNSKRRGLSFRAFPYRISPARGRGQTWRNTLHPELVISLHNTSPLPKRETAHSWHSFGCAVCLAHPLQLPFGCRIVCSVVVARHCVYLFFRRSASSNIALAVQRYAWEHSQSEPYFSGGLPRGGTPCIVVSQSPRKGLTQYDTADIALAIVVSTDTPGAPALAFSCSIITAALGIARASSALLSFARVLAITSSAGNSPVRGGEPLCVS